MKSRKHKRGIKNDSPDCTKINMKNESNDTNQENDLIDYVGTLKEVLIFSSKAIDYIEDELNSCNVIQELSFWQQKNYLCTCEPFARWIIHNSIRLKLSLFEINSLFNNGLWRSSSEFS